MKMRSSPIAANAEVVMRPECGRSGRFLRSPLSSISGKITLLLFGVSIVLTTVASAIYIRHDLGALREEMAHELTLLARVIGSNSSASLSFEDASAGERILQALSAKPAVVGARVWSREGVAFASYVRQGEPLPSPVAALEGEGHLFIDGFLQVSQPIEIQGTVIGSIEITSDLRAIEARRRGYTAIGGGIGLASIFCAIVLAGLLRRWISRPIEDLAAVARQVLEEKRYDLRVNKHSSDEVAQLVDDFNGMLAQIQQRDGELSVAKQAAETAAAELAELLDASNDANVQLEHAIREHQRIEHELTIKSGELERSNIELNQFAYVASHDLQEPLRMVTMFTQLLKRRYGEELDEDANEYIDFAIDGAARMRLLIRDLLEYSRAGQRIRDFEEVRCSQLVENVIANLKVAIEESEGRVEVGSLPALEGSPTLLSQLFQNLISNAIKFRGHDAPIVEISAQPREGGWLFSVCDNGIGIDSKFAERIFMVFQRLHTREEYEGTGIGLALCKRIVGIHGGEIWLESRPGGGSVFRFSLPRNRDPAPCEEAGSSPERGVPKRDSDQATIRRPVDGAPGLV